MRTAWLGHRSDTAKVGGSNPPRPTKTLDAEVKVNENIHLPFFSTVPHLGVLQINSK